MAPSIIPFLPEEIIMEIFLNLPTKSLLKCMCVSKSWNKLICSPEFVKTHLESSQSRVIFQDSKNSFKACCLPSLSNKEQSSTEVFDVQNPSYPKKYLSMVDSANGLILLIDYKDAFIWNPTIRKLKKLPKFSVRRMHGLLTKEKKRKRIEERYRNYGFGYDELHDDYKVVIIQYFPNIRSISSYTVVNMYSLRTDSWRIIDECEAGDFLLDVKFVNGKIYWTSCDAVDKLVNGKLYWTSSDVAGRCNACNVISLDLTNEKWRKLGLPSCYNGRGYDFLLGMLGSDLSMLCTLRDTCDVWILKDSEVNVVWTKMFTIRLPQDLSYGIGSPTFSYFIQSEGEILLFVPPIFMIYNPKDGSSRRPHVTGFEHCYDPRIYVESLVDPLRLICNL